MILMSAAPAIACNLPSAELKLDRSEELRDDFYLWIELGLYREATAEWLRIAATLDAAGLLLKECSSSPGLPGAESRLAVMRNWSQRAAQKKMDRFHHGKLIHPLSP